MSDVQPNNSRAKSDEIPPLEMSRRETGLVSLKCRTLEEASLICEELEKMDILISLPDDQELESQFEQNGYIEIKVSASAYSQLHDLASSVEFNYQQTAAEKRLSIGGMILSFGCGLLLPFGALVFLKLFGSDKKNGYIRRADEGAFWFGVGVVAWVFAILALYTALANNHNR